MTIVTVGIDLAKSVFAVHGVDETGKPALVRPEVPRAKLLELIAHLPPCLIGLEACSGAHHWAREFARFGHTGRLMAPKFVAPYRMSGKRGKNDAANTTAITKAVTQSQTIDQFLALAGDSISEDKASLACTRKFSKADGEAFA
jgi:transposase